jgi:hypothetical protein
MGIFSLGKKDGRFRASQLIESKVDVPNPARGWYRIAPYNLAENLDGAEFLMPGDERDRIVLVRVELSGFKAKDLTPEAVERLDRLISKWSEAGRDVVLRCCYDVQGLGYEREPLEFSQVLRHAHQVGEVVRSHQSEILVYQGLLVGSWGEMHHSRYLTDLRLRELYDALRGSAGPDVPIALRTPHHIRQVLGGRKLRNLGPLGLFNDGMMGSATDLSTFGTDANGVELPRGTWRRADELARLGRIGQIVPLGGEAVGKNEYSRRNAAYEYLRLANVTYLNRTHDPATISRWAGEDGGGGWNTSYDYIGAHLGYRLVCTNVRIYERTTGVACQVIVTNKGFSRPFFDIDATLLASEEAQTQSFELGEVSGSWDPEKEVHLMAHLPHMHKGTRLYMHLRRKRDHSPVILANRGAEHMFSLGVWC